jgi:lipooligosaccharide transport system ATP-binding protein
MTEPLLRVAQLTKAYGASKVVDALSFEIHPGECLGVIGPNGAGKTTTIRMCLGLARPDAGSITAFGLAFPERVRTAKERIGSSRRRTASTPTSPAPRTCASMALLRAAGRDDRGAIPKLLEFAALQAKAAVKPGELSGGMKRRLSLGRALINDPDLLVLDEPTTGLDPQARHLMWERLQNLLQQGKAILLTTHFMDEAERLCDRLIVLDHGRKIAEGKPRELIAEHLESDVVEVYGDGAAAAGTTHARLAERVEASGETVFFYVREAKPLLDALAADHSVRYLHRPANLEDLFLKLTGRQIRGDA